MPPIFILFRKAVSKMSTRALIGVKNTDSSITCACNLSDGYEVILPLLNDFSSIDGVNFLLQLGMFNTIITKYGYDEYIDWCQTKNIENQDKLFHKYGDSYVIQDIEYSNRKAETYKSIEEALNLGTVDVIYIFDDNHWSTYKDGKKVNEW